METNSTLPTWRSMSERAVTSPRLEENWTVRLSTDTAVSVIVVGRSLVIASHSSSEVKLESQYVDASAPVSVSPASLRMLMVLAVEVQTLIGGAEIAHLASGLVRDVRALVVCESDETVDLTREHRGDLACGVRTSLLNLVFGNAGAVQEDGECGGGGVAGGDGDGLASMLRSILDQFITDGWVGTSRMVQDSSVQR
jgi:hypothetical protein